MCICLAYVYLYVHAFVSMRIYITRSFTTNILTFLGLLLPSTSEGGSPRNVRMIRAGRVNTVLEMELHYCVADLPEALCVSNIWYLSLTLTALRWLVAAGSSSTAVRRAMTNLSSVKTI